MVMEGDVTLDGEHTVQCTDDVLWNCVPENYVILLTNVTPTNSKKLKEKEKLFNKSNYDHFLHFLIQLRTMIFLGKKIEAQFGLA